MKLFLPAVLAALALAGCGLNVQSPDLFLLTRTGQGKPLTDRRGAQITQCPEAEAVVGNRTQLLAHRSDQIPPAG